MSKKSKVTKMSVRLSPGDYETEARGAAAESRRRFLETLVRLDPRGVITDLHARRAQVGSDDEALRLWLTGLNLDTEWAFAWARAAVYSWDRFPLRSWRSAFRSVRHIYRSPCDPLDTRKVNGDALAPMAAYPDSERRQEFMARASAHWDARVQFLGASGAQPAPATKRLSHFEWLVRYQVGEESAYHIAQTEGLSGARAVLTRIRELSKLLGLRLRLDAK